MYGIVIEKIMNWCALLWCWQLHLRFLWWSLLISKAMQGTSLIIYVIPMDWCLYILFILESLNIIFRLLRDLVWLLWWLILLMLLLLVAIIFIVLVLILPIVCIVAITVSIWKDVRLGALMRSGQCLEKRWLIVGCDFIKAGVVHLCCVWGFLFFRKVAIGANLVLKILYNIYRRFIWAHSIIYLNFEWYLLIYSFLFFYFL